jgi:hypothetical protein
MNDEFSADPTHILIAVLIEKAKESMAMTATVTETGHREGR